MLTPISSLIRLVKLPVILHLRLLQVHSVVLMRLRYGLDGSGFEFGLGQELVTSQHPSRPALVSSQPTPQWVPGLFLGGKAAGAWL